MGLRTASVRRPYVEVMAPALTDTTQSQTFKLPPSSKDHHHLQPASPINNFSGVNHKYCYIINNNNHHHQQQPDNNGTNHQCLNDLINETLSIGGAGGGGETTCNPNLIMNNCQMGDQQQPLEQQQTTDNMGLEKAEYVETLTKLQNINKHNDVDQIINNLQTNALDLSQNDDDLMQVIKSIEENDDDPPTTMEEENVEIPIPTTLTFEKFLNDVDMMNISIEDDQQDIESNNLIVDLKCKQAKIERRLDFLLRKIRKLQVRHMGQHVSGEIAGVYEYVHRSLKRLKDVSVHEASSLQTTTTITTDDKSTLTTTINDKLKPMSYGSTKAMLKKLEMTTMLQANTASRQKHLSKYFGSGSYEPTNFRCNLPGVVNTPPWPIEYKHELQKISGLLHSELNIVQHEIDSEATESSSGGESCDEMQNYNNPHQQYLSIQKRALWKYLTARAAIASRWTWLQAQIADLEYRIRQHTDLYRQLRSSKGEIKLAGISPPSPTHLPDYGDIPTTATTTTVNGYRGQLPGSSPISFSKLTSPPPPSPPSSSTTPSILQDNCYNNSNDNVEGSSLTTTTATTNGAHYDYQCARTRPLVNFKKRRLVQINGLHAISKKANRPSTIRCGCVQPLVQCAVCTGRTDPTHPRDPSNASSKSEKIALVDSGYHPVFSLTEDISCGIHCDAIMKTSEWQQKSTRMKSLKLMKGDRSEKSMLDRTKKLEHRKKYGRILKTNTTSGLSTKIKHKVRGRKPGRHPSNFNKLNDNNKRLRTKLGMTQLQQQGVTTTDGSIGGGVDDEVESIGNNSNMTSNSVITSPSSSPLLHMQAISGYNRRNRTNSYDIDNIVIPYSVAAATRVEKLQYKEIPTPKWRIVEDVTCDTKNNGAIKNPNPSHDSDTEDLSEDAVIVRHDKSEYDEKKKFLSYLKLPFGHHGRSRSHKRTDSLAESSGANTPDPMSPHPLENHDNNNIVNSPLITSPPATPLSNSNNNNNNNHHHHNTNSSNSEDSMVPSISTIRRRTISQSRYGGREKDVNRDEIHHNIQEYIDVAPFDLRTFPLDDDTYDKMLSNMPINYQFKTNIKSQDSNDYNYLDDKVLSPGSESTESAIGEEDPNDPEWMDVERSKDRHKR